MKIRAVKALALSVAVAASNGVALAESAPEYDAGVLYQQAGKFYEAASLFQQAARRHPYSALVHYSLANSLVKLKAHDRAVQEYRMAYLLEPTGGVSDYCRKALAAYKSRVPEAAEIAAFQKRLQGTGGGGAASAAVNTALPPMDPAKLLGTTDEDRAIEAIRRQLAQEKLKGDVTGNTAALSAEARAKEEVARIEKNTKRQIELLYMPYHEIIDDNGRVAVARNMWYNAYNFAHPENLKAEEDRIRAKGEAAKEEVLRLAKLDRARYEGLMKSTGSALDEVAENLTNQLTTQSKSGVKLQARGTNLYVRQYIPFANKAASNAHSSVVRIVRARPPAEDDAAAGEPQGKPGVRSQITN